jgi:hypothetical protein
MHPFRGVLVQYPECKTDIRGVAPWRGSAGHGQDAPEACSLGIMSIVCGGVPGSPFSDVAPEERNGVRATPPGGVAFPPTLLSGAAQAEKEDPTPRGHPLIQC